MTGAVWSVLAIGFAVTALVVAGVLAARRRLLVVTVDGTSMQPTLVPGSRVLVRRLPGHAACAGLRTGQVVVLRQVASQRAGGEKLLVKRVAAVPGERVPESVLDAVGARPGDVVPQGRLVVLGDSAGASADSRVWGFAAVGDIVGVMTARLS